MGDGVRGSERSVIGTAALKLGAKVVGPLAYQGKEGCESMVCRVMPQDDGTYLCMGWHCAYCDEPCSSQGHGCDAAETLLGAAQEALE